MLKVPADFPHAGCAAVLRLKPDVAPPRGMAWPAEPVRVIRHNRDGTALVALTSRRFPGELASGNKTVPAADLFATPEEAMFPAPCRKRRKAA